MEFLEYITSNELLNYPFSDAASLTNGSYTFPTNFFIDAVIFGKNCTQGAYLKKFYTDGVGFALDIYLENGDFLFTVAVAKDVGNVRRPIAVYALYDNYVYFGKFLFGQGLLDTIFPAVPIEFTYPQTCFLPSVVVPAPNIVYSLGIDGSYYAFLLNHITLVPGCNVALEYSTEQNGIVISAGASEGEECECEEPPSLEMYISTIDGTKANETINAFKIEGSSCINVYNEPENHMAVITNECRPCCEDCDTKLTGFNGTTLSMDSYLDGLEARIVALGG